MVSCSSFLAAICGERWFPAKRKQPSGRLGHVLHGINMKELTVGDRNRVREAVLKYSVVVIPGQKLQPIDLERVARSFGHLVQLPAEFAFGGQTTAVTHITNMRPDGSIIPSFKGAEYWHNDGDFWGYPNDYVWSFLYSDVVPKYGGNTAFADSQVALETLGPEFRASLKNQNTVVDVQTIPDFSELSDDDMRFPPVEHQVIHRHDESGAESIYVGCSMSQLQGKTLEESAPIVNKLIDHVTSPPFIYSHKWDKDDLVIWDNKNCMHRSMGGYGNCARRLYRVQCFSHPKADPFLIEGETPLVSKLKSRNFKLHGFTPRVKKELSCTRASTASDPFKLNA